MAELLERQQLHQRKLAYRGNFENDPKIIEQEADEDLLRDVTLFDLIASFQHAVNKMPRKHVHEINKLNVSLEEQMGSLSICSKTKSKCHSMKLHC